MEVVELRSVLLDVLRVLLSEVLAVISYYRHHQRNPPKRFLHTLFPKVHPKGFPDYLGEQEYYLWRLLHLQHLEQQGEQLSYDLGLATAVPYRGCELASREESTGRPP